jgi:hypothetical protein
MNSFKELIRKLIKESLISEAKKDISELQKGYVLIITEKYSILDLFLYDLNQDKVVGQISAYKNSEMKNYGVSTVAAEYGFGSTMYEILMTYIYPYGIMPARDGDVREGAYNVYKKFFDRKDVKKISLKPEDFDYSEEIENMFSDEDEEFYILQTVYFYSFGKEKLNKLIEAGKKISKEKKKEMFDKATEFFDKKYN